MGGLNQYQYCPNPVEWIDPLGLTAAKEDPSRQAKAIADVQKQTRPDFYVGPAGPEATLPSTGYRYMDSSYASQTMTKNEAPLSYFGFSKFDTASEARDKFQVFYQAGNPKSWSDAQLRGVFDTLQLYDSNGIPNVKIPMEAGNTGIKPEPFTSYYPQYGSGGERQLIPDQKTTVKFDKVDLIPDK